MPVTPQRLLERKEGRGQSLGDRWLPGQAGAGSLLILLTGATAGRICKDECHA